MRVKAFRLDRSWSQEHLAHISGLSVRTIQRIENGQRAGLETRKCLAAVFETDTATLFEDDTMQHTTNTANAVTTDLTAEQSAEEDYQNNMLAFRLNLIAFMIVMPALVYLNLELTPSVIWSKWVAIFWAISFPLHFAAIRILHGKFRLLER